MVVRRVIYAKNGKTPSFNFDIWVVDWIKLHLLFEIKIIQEMQKKITSLKIPKGYAAVPLLFHIGGVASSVETDGYFYRIIDIADFLE